MPVPPVVPGPCEVMAVRSRSRSAVVVRGPGSTTASQPAEAWTGWAGTVSVAPGSSAAAGSRGSWPVQWRKESFPAATLTRNVPGRSRPAAISAEPLADVRCSDAMSVAALADALGVRPSTLRHWDAEGLVVPGRRPPRGSRSYSPAHVRDARIVHQLRTAGYRIDALRALLPALRRGQRSHDIAAALAARA